MREENEMAVGRNGAPYGASGGTRNPGYSPSPGRIGPSGGFPPGGGPGFTNPISGGGDHDEFNIRLLLSCAIGGAAGTALAMLLIRQLYESIPNIILYGMVMAVISLGVLIGAVTTTNMYGESFPKTIAVALLGTAIMFAAAALFEFVYEIKAQPKQEEEPVVVQEEVPVITDYIFCIDDSGSMAGEIFYVGNDPDGKRDTALENLLEKIDPASRVGILRYTDELKLNECVSPSELNEEQKARLLQVIKYHENGGGTNFEPVLERAAYEYDQLDESGRKPMVILMTDGISEYYDIQKWIDAYNAKGITVGGVYLGNDQDAYNDLEKICTGTGGKVVGVEQAEQLLSAFTQIVEEAETTPETVEEPEYIRFLAGPRKDADTKNVLAMIERLLFFGLLGLLLGGAIRIMLGEMLFKQIFIGGGLGLLAGAIVEFGYLLGLGPISRIGYLLYIIVIANYSILDGYVGAKWNTAGGGGAYGGGGSIANGGAIGQGFDRQNGRRIN